MVENPNFYYKKCKKNNKNQATHFLDRKYGEDNSFCSFINLMKEITPGVEGTYLKIESPRANLLINKITDLELFLTNFLKEKIKPRDLLKYPLDKSQKTFFSGSALTSIILNFLEGTLENIDYKDIDLYAFLPDSFEDETAGESFILNEHHTYIKNRLFSIYPFDEGEINLIFVKNNTLWRQQNFRELFEDFDLSCNQVFFDVANQSLSWTPLFVEFLENRLIRVNPALDKLTIRSMIRASKKSKEFRSKVAWDELEIPLLQKKLYYEEFKLTRSDYLGKDHLVWAKENILPFIHLAIEESDVKAHFSKEYPYLKDLDSLIGRWPLFPVRWGPRRSYNGRGNEASQIMLKHLSWVGAQIKMEDRKLPKNYLIKLSKALSLIPKVLLSEEFLKHFFLHSFNQNLDFVIPNDFHKTWSPHFELLEKVFKRRQYNIEEFYNFFSSVDKLSPPNPHLKLKWIGYIENTSSLEYLPKELPHLWKAFETFLRDSSPNLIPALDLEQWAHQVSELCSQEELDLEGKFMGHCVAGYGSALKRGDSRIFHLTTREGISTLELDARNFNIKQHKSFRNQRPPKANEKMARRFVGFLKKVKKPFDKEIELL